MVVNDKRAVDAAREKYAGILTVEDAQQVCEIRNREVEKWKVNLTGSEQKIRAILLSTLRIKLQAESCPFLRQMPKSW